MLCTSEEEYYAGFKTGATLLYGGSSDSNVFNSNPDYSSKNQYSSGAMFATPLFNLTSGHVYKFNKLVNGCDYGDCALCSGAIYNISGAKNTGIYRGGSLLSYRFTADSTNKTSVKFIDLISNIHNFYLWDDTDKVYVFKGLNVQ